MAGIKSQQPSRLLKILSNPPPKTCNARTIEFAKLGLADYDNHFAILIDDLFSQSECRALLDEAQETYAWEQALINIGLGQQELNTDIRMCNRIIWDDKDIADKILARVMPHLPKQIVTLKNAGLITGRGPAKRNETWTISRMNERLRFLKYTKDMYFRPHCDGSYITPSGEEITWLTVHLYLNGPESSTGSDEAEEDGDKPLKGGSTRFFGRDCDYDVNPKTGSVLVFQHRNLVHSGEDVIQGTKYTMRSDILYHKIDEKK